MTLTSRQLDVLNFIRRYRAEGRGLSPTLAEIGKEFNFTKIVAFEHVNKLIEKGYLRRDARHKSRALIPLDDPAERLRAWALRARECLCAAGHYREVEELDGILAGGAR